MTSPGSCQFLPRSIASPELSSYRDWNSPDCDDLQITRKTLNSVTEIHDDRVMPDSSSIPPTSGQHEIREETSPAQTYDALHPPALYSRPQDLRHDLETGFSMASAKPSRSRVCVRKDRQHPTNFYEANDEELSSSLSQVNSEPVKTTTLIELHPAQKGKTVSSAPDSTDQNLDLTRSTGIPSTAKQVLNDSGGEGSSCDVAEDHNIKEKLDKRPNMTATHTVIGSSNTTHKAVFLDGDDIAEGESSNCRKSSESVEQVLETPRETVTSPLSIASTNPRRSKTPERLRSSNGDQGRVSKSRVVSRHIRADSVGLEDRLSPTNRAQPSVSEEHLLAMLMQRVRRREQKAMTDNRKLTDLESANGRLEKANTSLKKTLATTVVERDGLQDNINDYYEQMNVFKQKYQKLKVWALAMNKEYIILREEGGQLSTTFAELQSQYKEVRIPLQSAVDSNEQIAAELARLRQELSATQTSIHGMNNHLQEAKRTISKKNEELYTLKAQGIEHKAYIQRLTTNQELCAKRLEDEQRQLTGALNKLINKIDIASSQEEPMQTLSEVLNTLQAINKSTSSTEDRLQNTLENLEQLNKRVDLGHHETSTTLKSLQDSTDRKLLRKDLSSIKELLKRLGSSLVEAKDLHRENAALQERVAGEAAVWKLIDRVSEEAERRQNEERENSSKLNALVLTATETNEERYNQVTSELEIRYKDVVTKWSTTIKQLEQTTSQMRQHEQESVRLRTCLENSEQHLLSHEEKLFKHYEQTTKNAKDEIQAIYEAHQAELAANIARRDEELENVTNTLRDAQNEITNAQQELRKLATEKAGLMLKLEKNVNEIDRLKTAAEKHTEAYSKLSTNYDLTKKKSDQVDALQLHLGSKDQEIEQLQKRLGQFEDIQQELILVNTRCDKEKTLVAELQVKCQEEQCEKERLSRELTIVQEELLNHERDAKVATEQTDATLNELKERAQKADWDVNRLQSLLKHEQEAHKKAQNSISEKSDLEARYIELQKELTKAVQFREEARSLKDHIKQKDDAIKQLNDQIEGVRQFESEILSLKAQIAKKDHQIHVLQGDIEKHSKLHAVSENSHAGDISDGLDGFFSQTTNLSMNASNLHESEDTDPAQSQTRAAIRTRPINHSRDTINPRIIMKICPTTSKIRVQSGVDSQITVIPDSQQEQAQDSIDSLYASPKRSGLKVTGSSPLGEINNDYADSDHEGSDSGCDEDVQETNAELMPEVESVVDQHTLPRRPHRFRLGKTASRKPSSIVSQDDMLLQPSEVGRHSSPRGSMSQQVRPNGNSLDRSIGLPNDGQLGTAGINMSPRKLRSDSQGNANHNTMTNANHANTSMVQNSREPTRPNSAVKRSISDELSATNNRQIMKKVKMTNSRGTCESVAQKQPASSVQMPNQADAVFAGTRSSEAIDDGAESGRRSVRRLKTSRNRTKADRYTARFNGDDQ